MSSFTLPKAHIDALLTAALAWGDPQGFIYRPLRADDPYSTLLLTRDNADEVGATLWYQNWYAADGWAADEDDSVEPLPPYTFEPLAGEPDPLLILRAIHCYGYQTGSEEYDGTEAQGFTYRLEKAAANHLPGMRDVPWVIESRDAFIESAARQGNPPGA